MDYFLLIVLWSLWCTLHSVLVSTTVTAYLGRRMGPYFPYYRLLYNLTSFLTVVPVALYSLSLKSEPFFAWHGPWRIGQGLLLAGAGILFVSGSRHYSPGQFLGINQIREGASCTLLGDGCAITSSGVLGVLRHPWYAGAILLIWARPWNAASLLTNFVLTAYLVIGACLEERKLLRAFGEPYKAYQRKVSMFIPWKWIRSNIRSRAE
jgi:methanethiol S-methyltransferase